MLRLARQQVIRFREPLSSSLALSLAGVGDAFLYPYLPPFSESLGISALWVGILLSVNRIVRILFNTAITRWFIHTGIRRITVLAIITAGITTLSYGLPIGPYGWLLTRIIWGVCYAVLRLSAHAYALEHPDLGLSLGWGRSLQELGPLLGFLLGPLLLQAFTPAFTFFILALPCLPAAWLVLKLPDIKQDVAASRQNFSLPSSTDTLTFLSAFLVEGVLIVSLGHWLSMGQTNATMLEITAWAAACLIFRRICLILLSPWAGWMAASSGFQFPFRVSVAVIVPAVLLIVGGFPLAGILLAFAANSVNSALSPGSAQENQVDPQRRIHAMAVNATWRDIGAAAGTLGATLITFIYD